MTNTKQISHRKPLNFSELSKLWISWKSFHVRPSTLSIYQCHIKAHLLPLLHEIPLDELSSEFLEQLCAFGLYHKKNNDIELSTATGLDGAQEAPDVCAYTMTKERTYEWEYNIEYAPQTEGLHWIAVCVVDIYGNFAVTNAYWVEK